MRSIIPKCKEATLTRPFECYVCFQEHEPNKLCVPYHCSHEVCTRCAMRLQSFQYKVCPVCKALPTSSSPPDFPSRPPGASLCARIARCLLVGGTDARSSRHTSAPSRRRRTPSTRGEL